MQIESQSGINIWSVSYNSTMYPPGRYEVQVEVIRCFALKIFCYPIGSVREYFEITGNQSFKYKFK